MRWNYLIVTGMATTVVGCGTTLHTTTSSSQSGASLESAEREALDERAETAHGDKKKNESGLTDDDFKVRKIDVVKASCSPW